MSLARLVCVMAAIASTSACPQYKPPPRLPPATDEEIESMRRELEELERNREGYSFMARRDSSSLFGALIDRWSECLTSIPGRVGGTLTGRVTTQEVVPDTEVLTDVPIALTVLDPNSGRTIHAEVRKTDADGSFSFDNVPSEGRMVLWVMSDRVPGRITKYLEGKTDKFFYHCIRGDREGFVPLNPR